jgi:cellulose synthase (UDP-forming)
MGRHARLVYQARDKVSGVAHHAKAGNINSALLASPSATGDFVLVLDCDMIVHPEFLQRTLGHFYMQTADPLPATDDGPKAMTHWVLKPKAAFLQVPQDFWNVEAADPLGHCARFFYGPMLQVSWLSMWSCPCCLAT